MTRRLYGRGRTRRYAEEGHSRMTPTLLLYQHVHLCFGRHTYHGRSASGGSEGEGERTHVLASSAGAPSCDGTIAPSCDGTLALPPRFGKGQAFVGVAGTTAEFDNGVPEGRSDRGPSQAGWSRREVSTADTDWTVWCCVGPRSPGKVRSVPARRW
jgi:hypothetical protein